jgi:hypothetical protein
MLPRDNIGATGSAALKKALMRSRSNITRSEISKSDTDLIHSVFSKARCSNGNGVPSTQSAAWFEDNITQYKGDNVLTLQ